MRVIVTLPAFFIKEDRVSELKSGLSLVVVIVVLFLSTLGMWWYTLNDNKVMAKDIVLLRKDMDEVQKHVEDSKRIDMALEAIRKEIQGKKAEDIRYDYLVEIVEKDVEMHCGQNCLPAAGPKE